MVLLPLLVAGPVMYPLKAARGGAAAKDYYKHAYNSDDVLGACSELHKSSAMPSTFPKFIVSHPLEEREGDQTQPATQSRAEGFLVVDGNKYTETHTLSWWWTFVRSSYVFMSHNLPLAWHNAGSWDPSSGHWKRKRGGGYLNGKREEWNPQVVLRRH